MAKGIEDSPHWPDIAEQPKQIARTDCVVCGTLIGEWHCADFGCVWCASCGANSKQPSKE